jgi:hypothetical protein
MFVSSSFLEINYGVDSKIAQFFVDREPPVDNLYWKDKLLYLRPSPGYLFIPLMVDLLYRLTIDREQLLSEQFVSTMEQIGHFSALEETGQITEDEAIMKSAELVKPWSNNSDWYDNLDKYFQNKMESFFYRLSTPFKALRRGDLFLFSLNVLSFSATLNEKIAEQWFALISVLLIMDDSEDINADKQTGDKNAFLESGLNSEGIRKIKELVAESLLKISAINPAMALQLRHQFKEHVENTSFFIAYTTL